MSYIDYNKLDQDRQLREDPMRRHLTSSANDTSSSTTTTSSNNNNKSVRTNTTTIATTAYNNNNNSSSSSKYIDPYTGESDPEEEFLATLTRLGSSV